MRIFTARDFERTHGSESSDGRQLRARRGGQSWIDLSLYDNSEFAVGRGRLVRGLWYVVSLLLFESGWFPLRHPKCWLLRLFGARIGRGVVIKPHVRIKYPWRLHIGDHCWIGQEAWIDNLADVYLGNHVCLSQRTYICTGSHDHGKRTFDLVTQSISVGNGAWVGAASVVLGSVRIGANALVAAGSVLTKDVEPGMIVAGVPGRKILKRQPPKSSGFFAAHDEAAY